MVNAICYPNLSWVTELVFFLSLFVLRETETAQVGEEQRERIPSRLCTVSTEPNARFETTNCEILTRAEIRRTLTQLSHPGTPLWVRFIPTYTLSSCETRKPAAPNLRPHISGSTNRILLTLPDNTRPEGKSSLIGQPVSCTLPRTVGALSYNWQPLKGHREWWAVKMLLPDYRESDTELSQSADDHGQQGLWESQKRGHWEPKCVSVSSMPKEGRALTKFNSVCFSDKKIPRV